METGVDHDSPVDGVVLTSAGEPVDVRGAIKRPMMSVSMVLCTFVVGAASVLVISVVPGPVVSLLVVLKPVVLVICNVGVVCDADIVCEVEVVNEAAGGFALVEAGADHEGEDHESFVDGIVSRSVDGPVDVTGINNRSKISISVVV